MPGLSRENKTIPGRPVLWRAGIAFLLALFAANHLEPVWRDRPPEAGGVVVRAESDRSGGHNSIGINEEEGTTNNPTFLRFSTLQEWAFDREKPAPCPASVRNWDGREVECIGFMYPLESGVRIRSFCLLRTTQTCCYGPKPQYNQYVLVEMKTAERFERLAPVIVRGRFVVDPQPSQGYIYRIEGAALHRIADEEPDIDPGQAGKMMGLSVLDLSVLGLADENHSPCIPDSLRALDRHEILVAGYTQGRQEEAPPRLLIALNWWDGVSVGNPPTFRDAALVLLAGGEPLPPIWKERAVFLGTLAVETNASLWSDHGIVRLLDSRRVRANGASLFTGRRKLRIPAWIEVLSLFAYGCLYWTISRVDRQGSEEQERKSGGLE